jgi:hypothetical protein
VASAITGLNPDSDIEYSMGDGIEISDDIIEKIPDVFPKVLNQETSEELVIYNGKSRVFSLTTIPNLIFKFDFDDREERFRDMVQAVKVCRDHHLNLLAIPRAKKFTIGNFENMGKITLIAEERFNIAQSSSKQEELYQLPGLDDAFTQLAIFIAEAGHNDAEWRNLPVLDDDPDFQGARRIALVDLEKSPQFNVEIGMFGGGYNKRGFVGLLPSERLIDMVINIASEHGIQNSSLAKYAKGKRMREIKENEKLQEFYATKGILENPRQLIAVDDLTTLGLNLEEVGFVSTQGSYTSGNKEKEEITLRQMTQHVLEKINAAILDAPEKHSTKGKRSILISKNEDPLERWAYVKFPKEQVRGNDDPYWLSHIVDALIKGGHIFKLINCDGHGYLIQA